MSKLGQLFYLYMYTYIFSIYIYIYSSLSVKFSLVISLVLLWYEPHEPVEKKYILKQSINEKVFKNIYVHIYDGYIYTYMIGSFVYFSVKFAKQKRFTNKIYIYRIYINAYQI